MNLLVVSSLTTGTTAVYLIEALKDLGCDVHVVSDIAHPLADEVANGLLDLRRASKKRRFDACLFVEGGTRRLFPVGMESVPFPSAWYAIDTHVHRALHRLTAPLFDRTFVAQREFLGDFPAGSVWLPLAADPALFARPAEARSIDIAYVGSENRSAYPERARLLDLLRSRYENVSFGRASPQEMGRLYSRAKLVFNKSVRNDVNMRCFEAMCAGAVLLTDRLHDNGLADLFEAETFVAYDDEHDLIPAIDRLLADDRLREQMGDRARAVVLDRHTYRHRAQAILDGMKTLARTRESRVGYYLPAFHLMRIPEGVLYACAMSLRESRRKGDRNLALALACLATSGLSALLVRAYRLRYRWRHFRLSRRRRRATA